MRGFGHVCNIITFDFSDETCEYAEDFVRTKLAQINIDFETRERIIKKMITLRTSLMEYKNYLFLIREYYNAIINNFSVFSKSCLSSSLFKPNSRAILKTLLKKSSSGEI